MKWEHYNQQWTWMDFATNTTQSFAKKQKNKMLASIPEGISDTS